MTTSLAAHVCAMPKAELHMHIEGSFEPELMFAIAKRNHIELPFADIEALRAAYAFSELQDFLNIYYQGMNVLVHEQDFYDLAMAYFSKAHEQNVLHSEIFFDPQGHTSRGVHFATIMAGLTRAQQDAQTKFGLSCRLIMCFLRHLSAADAESTLDQAMDFSSQITAVGLDSTELGHPPQKFEQVFERAKKSGFKLVAHAGEEGPADYVRQAIEVLNVDRIDHGNRALEDDAVMTLIAERDLALTLCPLSNLRLCVIDDMQRHPVGSLLERGVRATINSDDPAYFGGYVNENFCALIESLDLNRTHYEALARHSIEASFIDEVDKNAFLERLNEYSLAAPHN